MEAVTGVSVTSEAGEVPGIFVLRETFTVDSLNGYIDATTLPTVFELRMPALWPVPPSCSREEVCLEDETQVECWLSVNDAGAESTFTGVNPKEDTFVTKHSLDTTCADYLVTYQQYQNAGLMLFGRYVAT